MPQNITMPTAGGCRNKKRDPITSSLMILPSLLAITALTYLYDLYTTRRRFTPAPISHPCLLLRKPNTPLSNPQTRLFTIRPDRNILASGLLSHCHFEATVVPETCRQLAVLDAERVPELLELMVAVKEEIDVAPRAGLGRGPLPWATEGTPAKGAQREWVKRCARVLKRADIWDEDGEWEVWEAVVKNRCEGWVVEPYHAKLASLEDDDEMPLTWANGRRGEGYWGRWPGPSAMSFVKI